MKKICNTCGNELPEDSLFCQFCGSKDLAVLLSDSIQVEDQLDNVPSVDENVANGKKICGDCHMELPEDSLFCQYCGSQNVINIEETEQYATPPENNTNPELSIGIPVPQNDQRSEQVTIEQYKNRFITACVFAALFGCLCIYLYSRQATVNKTISNLQSRLSTAESTAKKNKEKASKYDNVVNALGNQIKYLDFYVSTQFVKGTNEKITVYVNNNSNYTITATGSTYVNCEWQGQFSGSGTQTAYLVITCDSGRYGTVTLTNSWNNEKIKIFVTGD